MIFESHAHYDDKRFDKDREELLSSLPKHNIGTVVNVSSDLYGLRQSMILAKQYDYIYAAVGIHPSEIDEINEEVMDEIREAAYDKKTVAIGEIGLDYHWEKESEGQERQKYWFKRQMDLAVEVNLPVIIHSRDAARDTFDILKPYGKSGVKAVIHCFSNSPEMAKEYVKLGFYIGVGGVVTFSNASKLMETVEEIPLSHILIETDCPYLTPSPFRGKRNDSTFLPYVIKEIARIKNITETEVIEVTRENAKTLFTKAH